MKIFAILKFCIWALVLIFTIEPITSAQIHHSNSYKKHYTSKYITIKKTLKLGKNACSINEQAKIKEINIKGNYIIENREREFIKKSAKS